MLRNWLFKAQESTVLENRKIILNLLEPNNSAKLLDVGCFDGDFTLELGKRAGTKQLYGLDVVADFIERCNAKGIKACRGDLNEKLPLDDSSFDVVHANQVFEHLHYTDLFIREIHRVLCGGGTQ